VFSDFPNSSAPALRKKAKISGNLRTVGLNISVGWNFGQFMEAVFALNIFFRAYFA